MRCFAFLVCLLFSSNVFCETVVIFDKERQCLLKKENPDCITIDEKQAGFVKALLSGDQTYKNVLSLETPPLAWGKRATKTSIGIFLFNDIAARGFVTELALKNLLPNHDYVLTLNGNPELEGNDLLPDPVPGNIKEKYYDFLRIKTGADGDYRATLAVYLKPGLYNVRLYVKDTDDFKIVLYRDFFKFSVH